MRPALAILIVALAGPAAAQTPPPQPPGPEPIPEEEPMPDDEPMPEPDPEPVPVPSAEPAAPVAPVAVAATAAVAQPALEQPKRPAGGPGRLRVFGGVALLTYARESQGIALVADRQPGVAAGVETLWTLLPRHQLAVGAQAAIGTDVYMKRTQDGVVTRENRFRQEVIELPVRWRWRWQAGTFDGGGVHASWLDLGYRGTLQRLHFIHIPGLPDGTETVYASAVEAGNTWQLHGAANAFSLRVAAGVNYAMTWGDTFGGATFGAIGMGGSARATFARRIFGTWLALSALIDYRRHQDSGLEDVTVEGMPYRVYMPKNETWMVMASLGLAFGPSD